MVIADWIINKEEEKVFFLLLTDSGNLENVNSDPKILFSLF